MPPVASSTAIVTSLFTQFWTILAGPGVYVLGGLLGVGVVFYAFKTLYRRIS